MDVICERSGGSKIRFFLLIAELFWVGSVVVILKM